DVLEAAGTKWNFLPFRPGLVGGHCIGVDPYYLTYKAQVLGHHPEVILAGRRINDQMGKFVAEATVKEMIRAGKRVDGARVLVLGLTFKENVTDLRNTRVVDVVRELEDFGVRVFVWDPVADPEEAEAEYGLKLLRVPEEAAPVDAVVAAVAHEAIRALAPEAIAAWTKPPGVLVDVKGIFDRKAVAKAGLRLWRL
ncbi:MAG: nucleotide sugar dehydrogenase, partial [Zetaproteobacteria bacterium]